ncbi:hypothetical protein B9Z55_004522 [Caenorhabditis nigoni]|uniref:Protein kinase domain-containing protein n=1 Tax=Caenorhabditis nigoni TaxID=1611254 RepID=A0A2G5UWR8_9PELO|nr:hypothetical protein B9Z55_004522 [Caenorhabditis nigoni]
MGITRETGKKAPVSADLTKKNIKTPNAKTPGIFASFRGKKPTVGLLDAFCILYRIKEYFKTCILKSTGGGDMSSMKSKTKLTDKKSTCLSGKTKNKKETTRRKSKNTAMKCFANGEMIEGVNQYKVSNQIRRSTKQLDIDLYAVKETEQNEDYRMKVARQGLDLLKIEAALLRKLEKIPGDKCFVSMAEFGSIAKDKIEFLIVSPYGATLHEVMKKVTNGPLSMDCAFYVAHQMLKAIRDLHSFGYIHRNIRPSAFNVGLGPTEGSVYLQDFRAVRKYEENKKHVTPRTSVKMFGSLRYASRGCQGQKDQSRKDDLESWLYTFFYLMDNGSLAWKKENNHAVVLGMKESFMIGEGREQFTRAPRLLQPLLTNIGTMAFESVPEYEQFKNCLENIQLAQNLNRKTCDWVGRPQLEDNVGDTDRSFDCKVTGERDLMVKDGGKNKKPKRKKLNSGDMILGVGAIAAWKVINLLGSGGFGDVYKVHRANEPPTKCYALKTESEEGEKRYLRLKIEVQVMMKTAEKKKAGLFKNFIEFVDKGKCEELKCKFVVMGLVGPSLEDIRRKYICCEFTKHTAFYCCIQTVTALRDLHSIGYLHRDIKPANYAIGIGDQQNTVYMLDFGIAKLYVDEKGEHKVKRKKVKFLGTLRFASRACMQQQEQGRKDDLETWIYMAVDLINESGMTWRKVADPKEILKLKKEFFSNYEPIQREIGKKNCLIALTPLVAYVDKMQYETTPDYDYILNFLKTCASDVGAKLNRKLDWIGKSKEFGDSDSEKSEKKVSGGGEEDE